MSNRVDAEHSAEAVGHMSKGSKCRQGRGWSSVGRAVDRHSVGAAQRRASRIQGEVGHGRDESPREGAELTSCVRLLTRHSPRCLRDVENVDRGRPEPRSLVWSRTFQALRRLARCIGGQMEAARSPVRTSGSSQLPNWGRKSLFE